MGWDAWATKKKQIPKAVWAAASNLAKTLDAKADKTVDGLLSEGGLDCSNCAYALGLAVHGHADACWSSTPWSAEEVQEFAQRATWPEVLDWANASAKVFLETCAQHNSGIRFSF